MAIPLLLPYRQWFDFSALPDVFVREGFGRFENGLWTVYAGVQWNGGWQSDESFWSERRGAYAGGSDSVVASVTNLSLVGASNTWIEPATNAETSEQSATSERFLRLPEGAALVASYALHYVRNQSARVLSFLVSCGSGSILSADAQGRFGAVVSGSYVLWSSARTGGGADGAPVLDGEWSGVRVQVGDGPWALSNDIFPCPGCPLYRNATSENAVLSNENQAQFRHQLDPLARVVSCSFVTTKLLQVGALSIAVGSLLLGGLRASERGPMSALWLLSPDGIGTLLATSINYGSGICECGKTAHYASDIGQDEDGTLFVLSECSLFRFEPQRATVFERLALYPARANGYPGGNCLRFPRGEETFWTENLQGKVDDGTAHYNRLVRRVGGVDVDGPSTLWHGTNCAEIYQNQLWAVRSDDNKTLFLDVLDGGRWRNFSGLSRPIASHFWQRLRAVGKWLYVFGYEAGNPQAQGQKDISRCALADGVRLRDAVFPFFIRRASVCPTTGRDEALFVVARNEADGIGVSNRVIEILPQDGDATGMGGGQRVCSFWNETAREFRFSRAAFAQAGGDVAKLPPFLVWQARPERDAGGVWLPAGAAPATGFYLTLDTSLSLFLGFSVGARSLPYDSRQWDTICFTVLSDGSIEAIEPGTSCHDARCALGKMPNGTKFRVIPRPVFDGANPASSVQLTDRSDGARLFDERSLYPCLWARVDSTAPPEDLSTYTQLLNYERLELLNYAAQSSCEVVVLLSPQNQPIRPDELPALLRKA